VIAQAAGDTGNDKRADQAGAIAHPNREVRNALTVQVAEHSRSATRLSDNTTRSASAEVTADGVGCSA